MEEEKDFLTRQKEDFKSHLFRAPSRRRWGVAGLAISLGMIYFGPATDGSRVGLAAFPHFSVLEGVGVLFGSLAELMPEEQTTLAGILRVWAGLFAACGFGLLVIGGMASPGP